eukprot:SAG31_NODE_1500_length_8090_cov_10.522588_8_plen_111_part_00
MASLPQFVCSFAFVQDMMGKQMTFILPNLVMMPTVSYFFSGFLTARVPFSLTPKFKTMFQRGVEVTSLDVSYVSSLSWYFMLFMGLRGVFSLILGALRMHPAAASCLHSL